MSIGSSGESTAPATPGSPAHGFLDVLRTLALIAAVAGAAGSIALMLRAGRRSPRLLIALFTIWVLSPFVALAWANMVSKPHRRTLSDRRLLWRASCLYSGDVAGSTDVIFVVFTEL